MNSERLKSQILNTSRNDSMVCVSWKKLADSNIAEEGILNGNNFWKKFEEHC